MRNKIDKGAHSDENSPIKNAFLALEIKNLFKILSKKRLLKALKSMLIFWLFCLIIIRLFGYGNNAIFVKIITFYGSKVIFIFTFTKKIIDKMHNYHDKVYCLT